jgi:hypothetical protein
MQYNYITWHPRKYFVTISKNDEVLIYMQDEAG